MCMSCKCKPNTVVFVVQSPPYIICRPVQTAPVDELLVLSPGPGGRVRTMAVTVVLSGSSAAPRYGTRSVPKTYGGSFANSR